MLLWVRRRLLLRALLLFSWLTSEASFSRGTLLTMAAAGSSTLASASSKTHTNECDSDTVHLIVLVHGWKGDSKEMGYMQRSLLRESEKHPSSRFVVHSSSVNEGRTSDGIAAGGERLAAEVSDMIASHRADDNVVTLSFVGNSLGGLYSRYAISKIDSSAVKPMVFCTIAAPHLGVSNHTYVPIPRSLEWVVAHVMHSTGKDLFQYTPIIKDMAFNSTFKTPLQRFRKRIAYANVSSCDKSGNTSLVTSCTHTHNDRSPRTFKFLHPQRHSSRRIVLILMLRWMIHSLRSRSKRRMIPMQVVAIPAWRILSMPWVGSRSFVIIVNTSWVRHCHYHSPILTFRISRNGLQKN